MGILKKRNDGRNSEPLDAFVSFYQKNHEFGTGYLLITKAGGVVTDSQGYSLRPRSYVFEWKTPLVAAATLALHGEILGLI